MDKQVLSIILELNPWLKDSNQIIIDQSRYQPRKNMKFLLKPDWDKLCLVLVGPRQSGKTTLGKIMCQQLIGKKRFQSLLYLICDLLERFNFILIVGVIINYQLRFELLTKC